MNKSENDFISLDEFSKFLQKRHLDNNFSALEQRLMFEKFDKNFEGKINVGDVLNYVGSHEVKHNLTFRDSGEVKTHVIDLLEKRRIKSKLNLGATETMKQLRSAFRNLDPDSTGYISKDTLRWALGPEYLALEITQEEATNAIEEIAATSKVRRGGVKAVNQDDYVSYDSFVHYLGLCNVDPNYHPFYDQRAQQLSFMQHKIIELDKSLQDPNRAAELKRVADKYGIQQKKASMLRSLSGGAEKDHQQQEQQQQPSDAPSDAVGSPSGGISRGAAEEHYDGGTAERGKAAFESPKAARRGKPPKDPSGKIFQQSLNDSFASSGSRRAHVDETIVRHAEMREETLQRRAVHQKGIWEGAAASDRSSPLYIDDRDRFHTVNAEYFPRLVYEPSKPVQRDRVGDSSLAYWEKEMKHEKRAQRIRANKQVTQDRLEYERFVDGMRQEEREKRKAQDLLNYEQTVLVRDMHRYNKRAVEVMQRKARPEAFTSMWAGHWVGHHKKPDDRDFGTTYLLGYGGNLFNGEASKSASVSPHK
jgi:Ca2+-binding EF-hand superfamily protein